MMYQTVIAAMGICKYRHRMHIEAQNKLHRCKKNSQTGYGQCSLMTNVTTPRDGGLMRKDMKNLFVQSHATNPDLDPS